MVIGLIAFENIVGYVLWIETVFSIRTEPVSNPSQVVGKIFSQGYHHRKIYYLDRQRQRLYSR